MSLLARAACAAAAALAVLFAPADGRAELTPSKLKQVFLDASSESAVSGGEEETLFLESIALKGKPSCVLVRYSGEIIGSDGDFDGNVAAVFAVSVDGTAIEAQPSTHEAMTDILPQIVAFSAFACGIPSGSHEVAVTMRPSDEDDQVAAVFRTLEVWTERAGVPIEASAPAAQTPTSLLKAKRAFVASSEEPVTARVDRVDVFHESVVLTGKPSCLLVRFSGEVQGRDIDENDDLWVSFEVEIGSQVPAHPNIFDLTASEQAQIVSFSAFRCGLEAGPYDVYVRAESADDDDPVEIRSQVLEIFTETGQPAPALAGAELVPMKAQRVLLASSSSEVVASASQDLFREQLLLKGKPGCILVRFSGELSGTNKDGDAYVVASFELAVEGDSIAAPAFQEAPTNAATRLVSLSGYACGLPAGPHEVSVRVRGENGDEVTVRARTLEVWTERGRVAPSTISLLPAD